MNKRYASGLVGLDIKTDRFRKTRPNRYRKHPLRRSMLSILLFIILIGLSALLGGWL